MIVSSHTPAAVSTTLEPCRVAPYVNVPSIRLTSSYNQMQSFSGFSAFDPALFSAAQQVNQKAPIWSKIKFYLFIFIPKFSNLSFSCYYQYAAAAAAFSSSSSPLVFCPQYPLGLAALAAVHQDRLYSKNSSIADLRFKAKKHAEALQMSAEKIWTVQRKCFFFFYYSFSCDEKFCLGRDEDEKINKYWLGALPYRLKC